MAKMIMESFPKELILSEHIYEISANIYKKRHFTVDIPSMYGSYHEMKFDAMGLTLRVMSFLKPRLEACVADFNYRYMTRESIAEAYEILKEMLEGLNLQHLVDEYGPIEPARAVQYLWTEGRDDLGPNHVLLAAESPRVVAVLDWELAQIGDPVRDLANFGMLARLREQMGTKLHNEEILPETVVWDEARIGDVAAVKLEGRQRSPAYIARVTRVWRAALDRLHCSPEEFRPDPRWLEELGAMAEGTQTTLGAYHRPWQ